MGLTDKAIFAIVERGKAEFIVEKAKEAGAEGATIVYGRGTGEKEFQNSLISISNHLKR